MIVEILGLLLLFKVLIHAGRMIHQAVAAREFQLLTLYGKGSYCLVTGPTEGIGLAFCNQFAKRGFNIVMVGRDELKMKDRAHDIKQKYSTVDIKIIKLEVTEDADQVVNGVANLVEQIQRIDISVVVNNLAIIDSKPSKNQEVSQIIKSINGTVLLPTLITSQLLPILQSRKPRSALIDIGSSFGMDPSGWLAMYSAHKSYTKKLNKGLSGTGDYSKTDFLVLHPNKVSSAFNGYSSENMAVCTADQSVESALQVLGLYKSTYGDFRHIIYGCLTETAYFLFPLPWAEWLRGLIFSTLERIAYTR